MCELNQCCICSVVQLCTRVVREKFFKLVPDLISSAHLQLHLEDPERGRQRHPALQGASRHHLDQADRGPTP